MARRTTFWPDTARMCASPERWKSVRTASDSRSSCPSTIPRSSAASFAGSPRASPTSARRRTRSSAPATPPRHAPGPPHPVHLQRRMRPAPPLERVELVERRDPPGEGHDLPHLGPGVARRREPGGPAAGHPEPSRPPALRGPPAARGRRRARRAPGPAPAPPRSPPSAGRASRAGDPRRAPRAGRRRTPLRPGPLPPPEGPALGGRGRGEEGRADRRHRRDRPEPQAGGEGEEDEVARMTAGGDHGRVSGWAAVRCAQLAQRAASHPHLLAQRGEALLSDPRDLAELLHRPEAAVLVAVLEDRGGHARADAVELVELLGARGVEVERLPLGRARPPPAAAAAPRSGTSTCRPSSSLAARLSAARSARRRAPPARRTASNTRAPAANRYTPGRRTAPATCTMSRAPPPPGLGHMDRRGGRRRVVAPQVARAQQHHDQQAERPQEQHVAGGVGHIPRR